MNSDEFAIIAPSVLSADFSKMESEIRKIELSGAEWVHLDVMDGSFVPPITFGHKMVSDLRPLTDLYFDVHLMVDHPENQIDLFADAGADAITFHAEAAVHSHRILQAIKSRNIEAGISLVPSTPVSAVAELLYEADLVLVMTVNPGYGGQSLIPRCVEKIRELKAFRDEKGLSYKICVDGGINDDTVETVRSAGADVMVSGSAFFKAEDPGALVKRLKGI